MRIGGYMKTKELLIKNGIHPNLQGFYAILLCVKYAREYLLKHGVPCSTTYYLYPKVAEALNTKPNRVERNIRHSIAKINSVEELKITKHPTNTQFIHALVVNSLGEK